MELLIIAPAAFAAISIALGSAAVAAVAVGLRIYATFTA